MLILEKLLVVDFKLAINTNLGISTKYEELV